MQNRVLIFTIINYGINSFFEEFAYRGFIQGYVNKYTQQPKKTISQGNWFATLLMLITHFGFFVIMDTLFAITGLILVFVYSLTAGYLRDRGVPIFWLIVLHTIVNLIHLFFNFKHYT